ncbi:MAG: nicotinate-nucleotide--dimethylbenzimidazole phosphoribosyltransferase [Magnetococcales bacterium]|nr:nicotinate-nucleotide--dimethylbenzimidazole phosphoribosyltransferase [Magnetococcales bacterium]
MIPSWCGDPVKPLSQKALDAARARQAQLTKPQGALGMLECLAVRLAGMQGVEAPSAKRVRIVVFAGDHGVTAAGISAFPQSVTVEMIRNFSAGGAAISVMARHLEAEMEVVDVGAATDPGPLHGVVSQRAGAGTANFLVAPAMSEIQLMDALKAGRDAVKRAEKSRTQVLVLGEMGIGNTTSAASIVCALLGLSPEAVAGPGTGLDQSGMARKAAVIQQAIDRHRAFYVNKPLEVLRCLGGFEIAALTGAYVASAQKGIPVVVDGFIASAAALVAASLKPAVKDWMILSHRSAEPGHFPVLRALGDSPLLQLDMRLGEGSGAAAAIPLIRLACALHNKMATFQEAGVSES